MLNNSKSNELIVLLNMAFTTDREVCFFRFCSYLKIKL